MSKLYVSCIVVALLALAVVPALAADLASDNAPVNLTIDTLAQVQIFGWNIDQMRNGEGKYDTHYWVEDQVNLYAGPAPNAGNETIYYELDGTCVLGAALLGLRYNTDIQLDFAFDDSENTKTPWGATSAGGKYHVCDRAWGVDVFTDTMDDLGNIGWLNDGETIDWDTSGWNAGAATHGRRAIVDDLGASVVGQSGVVAEPWHTFLRIDAPDGKYLADLKADDWTDVKVGTFTITISEGVVL